MPDSILGSSDEAKRAQQVISDASLFPNPESEPGETLASSPDARRAQTVISDGVGDGIIPIKNELAPPATVVRSEAEAYPQRVTPYSPQTAEAMVVGQQRHVTPYSPATAAQSKFADISNMISAMPQSYQKVADQRAARFMADKAEAEYVLANTKNANEEESMRKRLDAHEGNYYRDIQALSDDAAIASGRGSALPPDRRVVVMPPEMSEAEASRMSGYTNKYVLSPNRDVYLHGKKLSPEEAAQLDPSVGSYIANAKQHDDVSILGEIGRTIGGIVPSAGRGIIHAVAGGLGLAGQVMEGMTSDVGPNAEGNVISRFGRSLREEAARGQFVNFINSPDATELIEPKTAVGRILQAIPAAAIEFAPATATGVGPVKAMAFMGGLHAAGSANEQLQDNDPARLLKMAGSTGVGAGVGALAGEFVPETLPISRAFKGAPWQKGATTVVRKELGKWVAEAATRLAAGSAVLTGGQVVESKINDANPVQIGDAFLHNLATLTGFTLAHGAAQAKAGYKAFQPNEDGTFSFKAEAKDPETGGPAHVWMTAKVDPDGVISVAVPVGKESSVWIKTAKLPGPESQPSRPAPEPAASALDMGVQAAKAAKPIEDIPQIESHPNATKFTAVYKGREDSKPTTPLEASSTAARKAVALAMFDTMAGSLRAAGVDPTTAEAKATIHNLTDALGAVNGPARVADAWRHMGVPEAMSDALRAAGKAVKIDQRGKGNTKLDPAAMARLSWDFANEFHNQLNERVQSMPVSTDRELAQSVNERLRQRISPGSKYDNAYREGLGMPLREAEVEHIPVPPIVKSTGRDDTENRRLDQLRPEEMSLAEFEREYNRYSDLTISQEMEPEQGTPVPIEEWGRGENWEDYSRRRGYSEEAIGNFRRWLELNGAGKGLDYSDVSPEAIYRQLVNKSMEATHVEAGERTPGTETAVEESAQPDLERPRVQEGHGEVEAPGIRADEGGREPGSVLAEDTEQALPPELAARLKTAREALRGAYGVDDVKSLHEEALDMMPHVEEGEGSEQAAPPRGVYGPTQLLYHTEKSAPGSGMKRVLNLTDASILSPQFAQALGFDLPRGGVPVPGGALWAQLGHERATTKMGDIAETLKQLGFDGVAYTSGKGAVEIASLEGEKPAEALPAGRKSVSTSSPFSRVWGKLADGTWGYREALVKRLTPQETESALKAAETERVIEPGEGPREIREPITDPIERQAAVERGREVLANNHISANQLLNMAIESGAPIEPSEWRELLHRIDIEQGLEAADSAPREQRMDDYSRPTHTPSEVINKSAAYVKDGGLAFPDVAVGAQRGLDSMSILGALSKSRDLKQDIDLRKRYGFENFSKVLHAMFKPSDIAESDRKAFAQRKSDTKGSLKVYLEARNGLNKIIAGLRSADTRESVVSTLAALSSKMASGQVGAKEADIAALAVSTLLEKNPGFFTRGQESIDAMRNYDMERGVYDTEHEGKLAPLANHFEAIPVQHESFMTEDAPIDPRGAAFIEPGAFNVDEVSLPGEGVTMLKRKGAGYARVAEAVLDRISERGGINEANTQGLKPRTQHAPIYHATVDSIQLDGAAMERLNRNGMAHLADPSALGRTYLGKALIQSGYANLRLLFEAGKGKLPFHSDAHNVDPEFKKYYTAGEDVVAKLCFGTPDGMPVDPSILSTQELAILLDSNHPAYDATVERVVNKAAASKDIILSGTPMKSVSITTPTGRVSQLVPRSRLFSDRYTSKTIATPEGRAEAETRPIERVARAVVLQDAQAIKARMAETIGAMRRGEPEFVKHLGEDLLDRYIAANTILKAAQEAKGGKFDLMASLEGPKLEAVERARTNKQAMKALENFVTKTKSELDKAETPASVAARARAREILEVLQRAKSDLPYDEMFPGSKQPVAFPTVVAQDCIRNREQFLKVAEALGIAKDDPKTKHIYEQLSKIQDIFFERLGTNISEDPNMVHDGLFDSIHRNIKMAGRMKAEGRSASHIARTMLHEVAHAMTAYMSIPMQAAADKWFRAERDLFFRQQAASSKSGRSILEDLLHAETVHSNPLTNESGLTVSEYLTGIGTTQGVVVTPEAYADLVANHGQSISAREVTDTDGNLIGHALDARMFGGPVYRYTTLGEFIAETMGDALRRHARSVSKKGRVGADPYSQRIEENAGAQTAMDAVYYSTAQLMDVVAGKNVMRRFVGYLVNEGGLLERGLREGGIPTKAGERDIAFPQMAFEGGDKSILGRQQAAPPGKPITPENKARQDYKTARQVGWLFNFPRAMAMRALNAASVSDKARAAYNVVRPVLGVLGTNFFTTASALHNYYDRAAAMTKIDSDTRKFIAKKAESTPAAQEAKGNERGRSVSVVGPDNKTYVVALDQNGKYIDSMRGDLLDSITSYETTGKFSGELAGFEKPLKELNHFMWNGLSSAIANLSVKLDTPAEDLSNFDDVVKRVKNYLHHGYAPMTQPTLIERLVGKRMGTPEQGPEKVSGESADIGLGAYGTGIDPVADLGINAHMLLERQYGTYAEAIADGRFPSHLNVVDMALSGMASTLGVIARINAVAGMIENGVAVPGYSGHPEAKAWPNLKLNTVGLTDDLFGKALADIRIHPDAARVLDYGFRPNFLARTSIGRTLASLSGIQTVFQLFGANDYVNGLATVASFHGANAMAEGFQKPSKLAAASRIAIPALGAVAASAALGPSVMAGMSGALIAKIGAAGVRTLIRASRPMVGGIADSIKEGRRTMGILSSPDALHPEIMAKTDRELLAFHQLANTKIMENPVQIERFQHLVSDAWRRNQPFRAAGYAIANFVNKPQLWVDIGTGGRIVQKLGFKNASGFGGKAIAKLGAISLFAPAIMDKYRLPNGEIDWTSKDLKRDAMQLADDMDYQVGAVQGRNLSMNPSVMATGNTTFRAFYFRFTTEKAKALIAADLVNNLGSVPVGAWPKIYSAFREGATGGGTERPSPRDGSNFAWRRGTLAMLTLMLAASVLNRTRSMMSHVLWPDANYTQSDFARETYRQIAPVAGENPALAFRGLLTMLPPEGSSLYDAARHIMYEAIAPQIGHSDPTTGRPQRMALEGTMYARNLVEHPFAVSLDPSDQAKALGQWVSSGLGPAVSTGIDIARGENALGMPIGWGAPFNRVGAFEAYNKFFEKQADDPFLTNMAKAAGRSAAYTVSNSMPFFVRELGEYQPAGNWYRSTSQFLGGRAMPQTASMSEAEQTAFERKYTGARGGQSYDSVLMNARLRPAKTEMAETGQHTLLDQMLAEGQLGESDIAATKRYNKLIHDYTTPSGEAMPPIVRHLRGVMDSGKGSLKEVYSMANRKQKQEIMDYLNTPYGSGRDKVAREKIDQFKAWVAERESK